MVTTVRLILFNITHISGSCAVLFVYLCTTSYKHNNNQQRWILLPADRRYNVAGTYDVSHGNIFFWYRLPVLWSLWVLARLRRQLCNRPAYHLLMNGSVLKHTRNGVS